VTAAIALAVVLVIVVAGASMALEGQRSGQPVRPRPSRPVRPPRSAPTEADRPRRVAWGRTRPQPPTPEPPAPAPPPVPESRGPELLRSGTPAPARVISVVDERTIGPVTRSRLVLRIEPAGASALEVTVRHAFPTPEARAQVKVGASVPVRYDPGDPRRVVIDLPRE
jgi:hypothetical protein